jgi:hypothetical protein
MTRRLFAFAYRNYGFSRRQDLSYFGARDSFRRGDPNDSFWHFTKLRWT